MTKEEWVIKSLECCSPYPPKCNECPARVDSVDCGHDHLLSEALKLIHRLQSGNERLKIDLASEKKWGKIQTKQAVKDTAKEILQELDLFFKGTTFRKGYEFKKIDEKLKEIAKRKGVEVD